jgi:hypothetical protein
VLVARSSGKEPAAFWDGMIGLLEDYDKRIPA